MIDFEYGRNITEGGAGPDMTPMIDMIFQLLIFFLLTSFFILPAVNITLPKSRSTDARPPSSLILTVERDGSLGLAGRPVAMNELAALISACPCPDSRPDRGDPVRPERTVRQSRGGHGSGPRRWCTGDLLPGGPH